jgi:DNA-directed RNA polymerase specialized sigma24 family protein
MMEQDQIRRYERHAAALSARIDDAEAVRQALAIVQHYNRAVDAAVLRLRREGVSLAELAAPLGVSRQAVRQRWPLDPPVAVPPPAPAR